MNSRLRTSNLKEKVKRKQELRLLRGRRKGRREEVKRGESLLPREENEFSVLFFRIDFTRVVHLSRFIYWNVLVLYRTSIRNREIRRRSRGEPNFSAKKLALFLLSLHSLSTTRLSCVGMSRFLRVSTTDLDAEKGYPASSTDNTIPPLRRRLWADRSWAAKVSIVVVSVVLGYNLLLKPNAVRVEEREYGSPKLRSTMSELKIKVPGPEAVSSSMLSFSTAIETNELLHVCSC